MLSDDKLYPASAGQWVHVVRMEGKEDWVCGIYSTIQRARERVHKHQFGEDEIVSYILDAEPLTYE